MAHPPSTLQRLLAHLAPHRRLVLAASACSLLNKFFDLAPPVLIGLAVDVVVQQQTSWLARPPSTACASRPTTIFRSWRWPSSKTTAAAACSPCSAMTSTSWSGFSITAPTRSCN